MTLAQRREIVRRFMEGYSCEGLASDGMLWVTVSLHYGERVTCAESIIRDYADGKFTMGRKARRRTK